MLKRNIYKSSFCACANLLLESTLVLILATVRDSFAFPVCWEAISLGMVRKHKGNLYTHLALFLVVKVPRLFFACVAFCLVAYILLIL